ncbi:myb-related transcription factor, partner of profilin-like [Pseudophryne corroboree]|uniref:myb-related transcription factor, partner of profilin-like n=1 Tax=Pseudophryne corroboree TaxID=495146 RepID=UPI003081765A
MSLGLSDWSLLRDVQRQAARSPHSPHPSEELSLHSNEEWEPTQEEDTTDQACSDQPRSSRDQMEKSKKKKKPRQARSQPEEQSEEEASGEDAGPKKPRGPRYTEAENCALVDGVDRSYDVLYGPRAQSTAAKTKRNIWDAIARQVTAVSGNRRSTRNCMKRYSDCRRQTKKKMGIQRRDETATGGGPALNLKWLPWENVIKRRMNPAMVEGVRGGVDSIRPAGFPEEEEPPRRRKTAGDKQSKRRPDDSRAEVSSRTLEKSPELRISEAPGAAAPQDGEEVPQTSRGLASGIGHFYRPDLLQDSSEDDEVEQKYIHSEEDFDGHSTDFDRHYKDFLRLFMDT